MAMTLYNYPVCCTARVLTGFGTNSASISGSADDVTQENIRAQVQHAKNMGMALVTAVTNSPQKKAERELRAFGFRSTRPIRKPTHPETTIRHWTLFLDTWEG